MVHSPWRHGVSVREKYGQAKMTELSQNGKRDAAK